MTKATQLKVGSAVRGLENFTNQNEVAFPAGICSETAGSTGVFLGKVTIPPGGARGRISMRPGNPLMPRWVARKSKCSLAIGSKTARSSAPVTIGSFPPRCRTSP